MKKRIFLTFVLLGIILTIKAQSNFQEGYIVNLQQDTVWGYVNYSSTLLNEKKCSFKGSGQENPTAYEPTEIVAYGINKIRHYESRFVYLEKEEAKFVFIEKIIKGRISLYRYDKNFYIQKEDTALISLKKKILKGVYKGAKKVNINTNKHVGVLSYLMSDKPELKKDIQRVLLSESSLTNLITSYNSKIGAPSIAFKSNLKWTKFQFNVMGGYLFSKLNIVSNEHGIDYLFDNWDLAYSPTFGASIDISSPRLNERVKLTVGGNYYYAKYLAHHIQQEVNQEIRSNVNLEVSTISIPFGIRYTMPINRLDFNFGIGLAVGFALKQTSNIKQDIINSDVTEYYTKSNFLNTKRQESYWLSFGIEKAITTQLDGIIEFRLDKGRGLSEEIILEEESYDYKTWIYPHTTNVQILIGIQF